MKFLILLSLFFRMNYCNDDNIHKTDSFLQSKRNNNYDDLNTIEEKTLIESFMKEKQTKELKDEINTKEFNLKELETDEKYQAYKKENMNQLKNIMQNTLTRNLKNENYVEY